MKPFCEIIVEKILPPVRALIASKLVKKGMKQKDIAQELGITPAAVTQYVKKARGAETGILLKNRKVKGLIDSLVEDIASGRVSEADKMTVFCDLCLEIRKQGLLCAFHVPKMTVAKCGACLNACK